MSSKLCLVVAAVVSAFPAFAQQPAPDDAPLTPSRFITVNGLAIAVYESAGPRSPTVLFLHGNTSSSNAFARVFRSPLARAYHLVAIDLPGYGRSADAPAYDAKLFRDTVVGAAQALGADDGVIAAWSLGGDVALQSAAALPRLKGLFLTGTAPVGYTPELPPPFLSPAESPVGPVVYYGLTPNLTPDMVTAFVTAFFRPGYQPIPQFFYDDGLRTDPWTRLAVYLGATGQDPTALDEVAALRGLQIPVALLVGELDSFLRPAYLDGLAPSVPLLFQGRIIRVAGTGHNVAWESPDAYDQLLRAFLLQFVR